MEMEWNCIYISETNSGLKISKIQKRKSNKTHFQQNINKIFDSTSICLHKQLVSICYCFTKRCQYVRLGISPDIIVQKLLSFVFTGKDFFLANIVIHLSPSQMMVV